MSNHLIMTIAVIMIGLDALLAILLTVQLTQVKAKWVGKLVGGVIGLGILGGLGFGVDKLFNWLLSVDVKYHWITEIAKWFNQYGLSTTLLTLSFFAFFFLVATITHQDEITAYYKAKRELEQA